MSVMSFLTTLDKSFIEQAAQMSHFPVPVIKAVLVSGAIFWILRTVVNLGAALVSIALGWFIRPSKYKVASAWGSSTGGLASTLGYAAKSMHPTEAVVAPETPPEPVPPAVPSSSKVNPTEDPTFWG